MSLPQKHLPEVQLKQRAEDTRSLHVLLSHTLYDIRNDKLQLGGCVVSVVLLFRTMQTK